MEIDHENREIVDQIPPFFYLYKDGFISRRSRKGPVPPSLEPRDGVVSKDVSLDSDIGLWVRIFSPCPSCDNLPVVLYFHASAFLFGSPAWGGFHGFCSHMARRSNSIWVSTSYRLAPEHRLPAAYDDCFAALRWVLSQAQRPARPGAAEEAVDPLLAKVDFSRCFLAGDSAGANIVHHVAMRAVRDVYSANFPIQGLILIQPAFGSENSKQAEMDCPQDDRLNERLTDTCLRLAFPEGANRDHPFLNPLSREAPDLRQVKLPRMLVTLADGDAARFAGMDYCEAMRKAGHSVEVMVSEGVGHIFHLLHPQWDQAQALFLRLASFITQD